MSVIDFAKAKEERESGPHLSGNARCMGCQHQWGAVVPVGTVFSLECPACGCMKGALVYDVYDGDDVYVCRCGLNLMRINPEGAYCANCGVTATF